MVLLFAFLVGVIAGLRAFMAPALVSLAAGFGWINLEGSPLHFMGHIVTRVILCLGALGELVNDKLPKTPSRKVLPQFIARIVTGSLSGATIGASQHSLLGGLAPVSSAMGAAATPDYFKQMNIRHFINAGEPYTTLSGSMMLPEVAQAMGYAARQTVRLDDG